LTCYELYLLAKEKKDFKEIVKSLNVVTGTAKRWENLKSVPEQYRIDLMKLCNLKIDYSQMTAREKNQFFTFTQTAEQCVQNLYQILEENNINIDDYIFIEPSAGAGVFLQFLPEDTLAFDIENFNNPKIIIQDFLDWQPNFEKKYIVIGNPPFGLRGQQALKFINKALTFADFCAFILPPLFNSDGRGSPKKRIEGNLLFSTNCASDYNYPDGSFVKVETIFQIWTRLPNLGENTKEIIAPKGFKIFSLSDGGTPGTTRNKDKIDKCDYYLPSTCFGQEKIHLYKSFRELPQQRGYGIIVENNEIKTIIEKIKWDKVAFYSTNGASNLRSSLIIKAINNEQNGE